MMRKILAIVLLLSAAWLAANRSVHAQGGGSTQPPSVCYAVTHTSCVIQVGITTYAWAADGAWISTNGGVWVQFQTGIVTAGVTSITVNGGTAQNGAVALTIPTKATTSLQ